MKFLLLGLIAVSMSAHAGEFDSSYKDLVVKGKQLLSAKDCNFSEASRLHFSEEALFAYSNREITVISAFNSLGLELNAAVKRDGNSLDLACVSRASELATEALITAKEGLASPLW